MFKIGDKVHSNYGPGKVVLIIKDEKVKVKLDEAYVYPNVIDEQNYFEDKTEVIDYIDIK